MSRFGISRADLFVPESQRGKFSVALEGAADTDQVLLVRLTFVHHLSFFLLSLP